MAKRAPTELGQRIHHLRTVAELKARELDRLADTTEGHVSLIESGMVENVSTTTAAKIARALGASLDWLVSGDGKEPSLRAVRAAVEVARAEYMKRQSAA